MPCNATVIFLSHDLYYYARNKFTRSGPTPTTKLAYRNKSKIKFIEIRGLGSSRDRDCWGVGGERGGVFGQASRRQSVKNLSGDTQAPVLVDRDDFIIDLSTRR